MSLETMKAEIKRQRDRIKELLGDKKIASKLKDKYEEYQKKVDKFLLIQDELRADNEQDYLVVYGLGGDIENQLANPSAPASGKKGFFNRSNSVAAKPSSTLLLSSSPPKNSSLSTPRSSSSSGSNASPFLAQSEKTVPHSHNDQPVLIFKNFDSLFSLDKEIAEEFVEDLVKEDTMRGIQVLNSAKENIKNIGNRLYKFADVEVITVMKRLFELEDINTFCDARANPNKLLSHLIMSFRERRGCQQFNDLVRKALKDFDKAVFQIARADMRQSVATAADAPKSVRDTVDLSSNPPVIGLPSKAQNMAPASSFSSALGMPPKTQGGVQASSASSTIVLSPKAQTVIQEHFKTMIATIFSPKEVSETKAVSNPKEISDPILMLLKLAAEYLHSKTIVGMKAEQIEDKVFNLLSQIMESTLLFHIKQLKEARELKDGSFLEIMPSTIPPLIESPRHRQMDGKEKLRMIVIGETSHDLKRAFNFDGSAACALRKVLRNLVKAALGVANANSSVKIIQENPSANLDCVLVLNELLTKRRSPVQPGAPVRIIEVPVSSVQSPVSLTSTLEVPKAEAPNTNAKKTFGAQLNSLIKPGQKMMSESTQPSPPSSPSPLAPRKRSQTLGSNGKAGTAFNPDSPLMKEFAKQQKVHQKEQEKEQKRQRSGSADKNKEPTKNSSSEKNALEDNKSLGSKCGDLSNDSHNQSPTRQR